MSQQITNTTASHFRFSPIQLDIFNHHSNKMVLILIYTLNCLIPIEHLEQCLGLRTVEAGVVIKSDITTIFTRSSRNT